MANIKMVALRRHAFGVGMRETGEQYEASPGEAATLKALGWAREASAAKPEAKPQAPAVHTAKVEAETVASRDMKPAKKAAKKASKQTYRTRDMKAKE